MDAIELIITHQEKFLDSLGTGEYTKSEIVEKYAAATSHALHKYADSFISADELNQEAQTMLDLQDVNIKKPTTRKTAPVTMTIKEVE